MITLVSHHKMKTEKHENRVQDKRMSYNNKNIVMSCN